LARVVKIENDHIEVEWSEDHEGKKVLIGRHLKQGEFEVPKGQHFLLRMRNKLTLFGVATSMSLGLFAYSVMENFSHDCRTDQGKYNKKYNQNCGFSRISF
jgi:hypothetical protein